MALKPNSIQQRRAYQLGPPWSGARSVRMIPGSSRLEVPDHQPGAAALGGWGTAGGATTDPRRIGTGSEALGGQPGSTIGAASDVLPVAHTGMPALSAYLLPQLGTGDAAVAEHDDGQIPGNRRRQFLEQCHGGVHPGAPLGGAPAVPGHGDGATAVDTLLTLAVVWSPCSVGSTARARRPERHQARTHRSKGAKQSVTSSSVGPGRARSLPSYRHSRRYWRRRCQLPQGESAEATASWPAAPARMPPQTHRTRPVNGGWERCAKCFSIVC